ncbi:serine acetyltransferase [Escherichia coli]
MLKYILAINFILFGNTSELFAYWKHEVIRRDKFSLHRLLREKKHFGRNYLFWWRLANEMYIHGSKLEKKAAKQLNANLLTKFGCEISLGARIGKGLKIPHHHGIVIHHAVSIGENFVIRQNTTIGQKDGESKSLILRIGDNVDIGANTCIIGLGHNIGDNVKIGAMSLVNSDIPNDCTFITTKTSRLITHNSL